jgi:hypothetical protein
MTSLIRVQTFDVEQLSHALKALPVLCCREWVDEVVLVVQLAHPGHHQGTEILSAWRIQRH